LSPAPRSRPSRDGVSGGDGVSGRGGSGLVIWGMAGGRGGLGAATGSGDPPLGGEALAGGEDCGAGFGAATGCVSETGMGAGGEASAGGGAVVGGGAGGAAVPCADDRLAARVVFRSPGKSAARPSARSRGRGAGSAGGALRLGRARGLSSSSRMALPAASEAPNRPAHAAATGSVRRRVITGVCSCRRWPGQDQGKLDEWKDCSFPGSTLYKPCARSGEPQMGPSEKPG
jgi:hypothetical protein